MEPPAPPPPASFWLALIGIAALSCFMVLAMVRYSRALLAAEPAPGRRSFWGATYALAWAGIIAGFLWMFHAGRAMTGHNLTMLAIVAGFWWGLHALMIAFARAIRPSNDESSVMSDAEADESGSADATTEPAAVSEPVPASPPFRVNGFGRRVRNAARMVVTLVVVLLVIGIGEAMPGMRRLTALLDAHRYPLLPVTITAAILGTLMLAGGGAAMAIRGGRRMTRAEIDRTSADVRILPRRGNAARKAVYRNFGDAQGVSASDEVSLAELKHAWRSRAWRDSPRWRIIFVMACGAAVMALGIWGTLLVVAPAGVKFFITLVFGYALVRTLWALYRC